MGGLCGLIHFQGDPPDPSVMRRMSERIAHRGPAASGEFVDGPVALGHRLRRVSVAGSVQPLVEDDVVVMLDGWIYDHQQLAASADSGPPPTVDTQAVVRAWRRWGPEFIDRVEGEFALVVWERKARVLHLYRDRMGVRPLFWARRGDRVAFASELPALLPVSHVSSDLAHDHLAEYLSFHVVHAPRTLLRDVHQVRPAHHLAIDEAGERSRSWWSLSYAPLGARRPAEGEVVDAVEEAVVRAVRRRVPAGVETGLFLSGGLGSTAIAAAARKRFLQLPSFTVAYSDDLYPELPFAGRVAGLLGLEHHQVEVGTRQLADGFDEAVRALGHPVGSPSTVLQMALAKASAQHVGVALSGDGGEELFGGRQLDRLGRRVLASKAVSLLPGGLGSTAAKVLGVRHTSVSPVDYVLGQGLGGSNLFSAAERGRLLRDNGWVRVGIRREVLAPFYAGQDTDAVNLVLHGSLRSHLVEGDLVRAERTASAAGLDLRFPLLDREVLEASAGLPGASKLVRFRGSMHTRWPLRAMVAGTLPTALLDRPKRDLPKPMSHWLEQPGRLFMEERFARLMDNSFGLWRREGLLTLRQDLSSKSGAAIRLWTLFVLDSWLRALTDWKGTRT